MSSHANIESVLNKIEEHEIEIVDLQFTDLRGTQHHISIPTEKVDADLFEIGKGFDGSSIPHWRAIHHSDMLLVPDPSTAILDPFYDHSTLYLRCDIVDPQTMQAYDRDPRQVARRAETYIQQQGIADHIFFGPEPEFCIFDDVRWECDTHGAFYKVDDTEGQWNSGKKMDAGNLGHRPRIKGGYFPLPPVDSGQNLRTAMVHTLHAVGQQVEAHHHEVAVAQHEIAVKFNTLLKKADELQLFKHIIRNVAHAFGKTATFMPKPLVGDNGNGMHCHQSLHKNGENLFAGNGYANLSDIALYYIGGIIKHAHTLNAFTNPSTNSYRRLVPGFEAPVLLAYSACNRSAAIRIPQSPRQHPLARRIEVRFPDPLANPYLAFSAMVMAGIDGIKNKIHPGEACDKDLYELSVKELSQFPHVAASLTHALDSLEKSHDFLLAGDVFNVDLIQAYIALKREEVERVQRMTHPLEFDLYYSG